MNRVGLLAGVVLLFTCSVLYACWRYTPLYEIVEEAELIVVGKVVRIDDPASEDLKKTPAEGRKWLHGPDRADATAFIKVEEVLLGNAKVGEEVPLLFPSPASNCQASTDIHWDLGDDGVWLLSIKRNGKWCDNSPFARYSRKFIPAVKAILKVTKNKEHLQKYVFCEDSVVWGSLFEMLLRKEDYTNRKVMEWLVQLPLLANSKAGDGLGFWDILWGNKSWILERAEAMREEEAVFCTFALYVASQHFFELAKKLKIKDDGLRVTLFDVANTLARFGSEILIKNINFGKWGSSEDRAWCASRTPDERYDVSKRRIEEALHCITLANSLDEEQAKRLKELLEKFESDEWRIRKDAEKRLSEMVEQDDNYALLNALLRAYEKGNAETRYRIERATRSIQGKMTLLRLRSTPLIYLPLLLSEDAWEQKLALKYIKKVKDTESKISKKPLRKRLETVLSALQKIYSEAGTTRK